jgi:hypothetical protein
MNTGYNTQKQTTYIPLGMYRSVEIDVHLSTPHPNRDASLTGCRAKTQGLFSTERCIPMGCQNADWVLYPLPGIASHSVAAKSKATALQATKQLENQRIVLVLNLK